MARNTNDVELIIRAKNEADKTFEDVQKSLEELKKEVSGSGLAGAFDRLTQSTDDFAARQKKLDSTIRDAAEAQATLGKVIRDQEREYSRSEKSISRLTAKLDDIRGKFDIGPLPEKEQDKLRNAYEETNAEIRRQEAELKKMKAAHVEAGVGIDSLRAKQKRLEQVSEALTAESRQLAEQMERTGAAARRSQAALFGFGDSTRQSLSFTQRLRGEVLALTASYVGLYGAIQGVSGALDTRQQFEAIEGRLKILTDGDEKQAAELLERVGVEADRLGLQFDKLAEQYSKFSIAAKQSNFTLEETNSVFRNVSEAVRGARLGTEQTERVFYALEQIISKGTVNTEELRQQLGEALPGAFSLFAKSIGVSEAELGKLLEQSKVTSRALIPFAKQLAATFGPGIQDAQESLNAEMSRFKNQIIELRREFANDQFAKEFAAIIRDLTNALGSDDVRRGIGILREGFLDLSRLAVTLVENIDAIISVLKVLATAWGLSKVYGMSAALAAMSTNARGAAVALGLLRKALLALTLVYAVYEGVELLRQEFQDFEAVLLILVNSVKKLGVQIPAYFNIMVEQVKVLITSAAHGWVKPFEDFAKEVIDLIADAIRGIAALVPAFKSNLEALATELESFGSKNKGGLADYFAGQGANAEKEIGKLKKQLSQDLDDLNAELNSVLDEMIKSRAEAGNPKVTVGAGLEGDGADPDTDEILRAGEEAAKKAGESLAKIIRKLQAQIADQGARSLIDRQKAIEESYNELIAKLDKIDEIDTIPDDEVDKARDLLDKLVQIRKEREAIKYNQEQLAVHEREISRLMQARSAEISVIDAKLKAGLINQLEAQNQVNDVTERYKQQLIDSVKAAREFAQVMGDTATVAKMDALLVGLQNVTKQTLISADAINNQFAGGLTRAFDAFIQGTQSAGQAFRQFAADFLREISKMILQQIILNALQNSGFGGGVASFFPTNHTGGIVGNTTSGKFVNPMVFAGAVKYHTGGIAGLKPNEVPSILEKGEEVITKNDPRHRNNGGAGGGDGGQPWQIINSIDSESVLSSAINKPGGKKQMLNFIRANKGSIKSMLT